MNAFMKARPVVRRASATHYQIRRFNGDGRYLVWPDGRPNKHTAPIASAFDLARAVELARRPGVRVEES